MLLLALDYGVPVALALVLVAVSYQLNISRCRGWPDGGDIESHIHRGLIIYHAASFKSLLDSIYPPLVYIWTNLFYLVAGPTRDVAEVSVGLFLVPFCLATYHLAKQAGGRAAGLAMLILFAFNRDVLGLTHTVLQDLPLVTIVTATLWAFLRSDHCRHRRSSLVLGVCVGLGMLTKYNYFYFSFPLMLLLVYLLYKTLRRWWLTALLVPLLGAPVAWFGSRGAATLFWSIDLSGVLLALAVIGYLVLLLLLVWQLPRAGPLARLVRDPESHARLVNLLLAVVLAALTAMPWYGRHLYHLWRYWDDMLVKSGHHGGSGWGFFHQLSALWVGVLPMLGLGLVLAFYVRKGRPARLMILFGGAASLLLMAATMEHQQRFFLPLLPFVAVLGTWWIRRTGRWSWAILVALLAVQLGVFKIWGGDDNRLPDVRLPERQSEFDDVEPRSCKLAHRLEALAQVAHKYSDEQRAIVCRDRAEYEALKHTSFLRGLRVWMLAHHTRGGGKLPLTYVLQPHQEAMDAPQAGNPRLDRATLVMHPTRVGGGGDFPGKFKQATGQQLKVLRFFELMEGSGVQFYRVAGAR